MKAIGQLFMGLLAAAVSALIVLAAASQALLEGGAVAAVPATVTFTAAPPAFTASPMPLRDISPSPTQALTPTATQTEISICAARPTDWVPYTTQDGDTLDSLAARSGTTTDAIMKANCIPTGFQLRPGWLIYLPPSAPTLTPTFTETPTPTELPTLIPTRCGHPAGWIIYIVRPGDTLFMLSRYYAVSVGELMQANCLNTYQINVGQRLYVPNRPTMTPVVTNTPVPPTETETETPVPTETTVIVTPKVDQTIIFDPLPNKTYGDQDFKVNATASSKLPVTFSASGACTITGDVVTLTGAGSCSITASQEGDISFNPAAPVTRTFQIAKANQTITFPAISGKTFGDPPFRISASATSNLTVSFTSSTPDVCTVAGDSVTINTAGDCTITAVQAGDTNFNAATSVPQTFPIAKASQTITFPAIPDKTTSQSPVTISASASSALPVSFSSDTPGVCTVAGDSVTINAAGACTITASQPGNKNYLAALNVSRTFQVTAP